MALTGSTICPSNHIASTIGILVEVVPKLVLDLIHASIKDDRPPGFWSQVISPNLHVVACATGAAIDIFVQEVPRPGVLKGKHVSITQCLEDPLRLQGQMVRPHLHIRTGTMESTVRIDVLIEILLGPTVLHRISARRH